MRNAVSRARHAVEWSLLLAALLVAPGCERPVRSSYRPVRRSVTITTIPLLTREMQQIYPFLKQEFAPGGILAGKEIYSFMPSTVTVVAGDTIDFEFINPEDDLHSFVLPPDLSVALPGSRITRATYVARRPGIFRFTCSIASHLPSMWGQLVVLSPGALEADGKSARGSPGAR